MLAQQNYVTRFGGSKSMTVIQERREGKRREAGQHSCFCHNRGNLL